MESIKNIIRPMILVGLLFLQACHKEEMVNISKPETGIGQEITSDTLSGTVKGTMRSGKTYYFSSDIVVNAEDTLLMQEGVKLIALGDGSSYSKSPQITVNGTFISLGTQDKPNYITVLPEKAIQANAFTGFWGGIQGGSASGDIVIKWTHIEFAGGPAGPSSDPAVYKAGDPRYGVVYTNNNGNLILEDSWISNTKDDGVRVVSGKISIMRNIFENNGESGGEAFNAKSGTVGDLAYNLFLGSATNGTKISNSGGTTIQCNINNYNNTYANTGFRQVKAGRGGSINYEKGAKGKIFNNLYINCRYGLGITKDADIENIHYDNQYYYGVSSNLLEGFYSNSSKSVPKPGDIISVTPKDKAPLFASYNVNAFDYGAVTIPLDGANMPLQLLITGSSNFNLLPGSPAINKGKTDFQPLRSVEKTGIYGADISLPGKDIGAFQTDGSGNMH